ncbi:Phosphoribosylaminoimidazolesuccinocarboxamidesynthase [Vulcanisaeta moutnovskia 768-28]|uniref:Phosphoribosylaminoimidazole-succinocarboxamide synthase n=1 Tax=Vulcanisaeta moutnovskia (strain 768-28) TaxID=985053 RepID=F0QVW6_VULM7|nr:phosphoribosylaminoimidazolesuccinocarboxamide synthase [Vulcanisaeta moutnovskia]ADY02140.1 Phosphoribosylaminoimidazolesuccinocarboxamidesynthase [Vulcanisaeta moutnovskia 768-28]
MSRNWTGELIYEGKAKRVYRVNDEFLVMEFKDEVTAFDGARKEHAPSKGKLAAAQTVFLMGLLGKYGIRNHLVDWDGDRKILVRSLRMIPIEVIVRNYAYGSFLKRMPLVKSMTKFSKPLIEFHLKSDELHDPLITTDDIIEAGLASQEQLNEIMGIALRINEILNNYMASKGLTLVDFKLEFGFDKSNNLVLADELSGDTIRVLINGRHLDKELFRRGSSSADLVKAYEEMNKILGIS